MPTLDTEPLSALVPDMRVAAAAAASHDSCSKQLLIDAICSYLKFHNRAE